MPLDRIDADGLATRRTVEAAFAELDHVLIAIGAVHGRYLTQALGERSSSDRDNLDRWPTPVA